MLQVRINVFRSLNLKDRGGQIILPVSLPVLRPITLTRRPTTWYRTQLSMGSMSQVVYRRELLATIDHLLFVGFVLSYLLSPSHLITLLIRITSQVQFGTPRRYNRPLRFFLFPWFGINLVNIIVHSGGSKGIKGRGWSSGGLLLDFIGQSYTPSTLHLIVLDLLIAGLQFLMIVISYGDAFTAASSLLGIDDDEQADSDDDEEDEGPISKRKDPTSIPVVNIRFRAVLKEAKKDFWSNSEVDRGISNAEEGRSTAVPP